VRSEGSLRKLRTVTTDTAWLSPPDGRRRKTPAELR
jgi:hypothetical protein